MNYILFVDVVNTNWIFILMDQDKNIFSKKQISLTGQESKLLLRELLAFLNENNLKCEDCVKIIVVNGPGSFTWIRTITLIINSIVYIYKDICVTPVSFFELHQDYPIIKASSKRDVFIKKSESMEIEVLKNEEVEDYLKLNNIKKVYWDIPDWLFSEVIVAREVNYDIILKNLEFEDKKRIEALYIKKPNIS